MILNFICATPHPVVPALAVGDRLALVLKPTEQTLTMRATPAILRRLIIALRAGALREEGPCLTFTEIEADVEGRWLELTARLDQLAAQAEADRHPPLHLAG